MSGTTRNCIRCGITFTTYPPQRSTRKHCSYECYLEGKTYGEGR